MWLAVHGGIGIVYTRKCELVTKGGQLVLRYQSFFCERLVRDRLGYDMVCVYYYFLQVARESISDKGGRKEVLI